MNLRPLRIAIDMDGILADLMTKWLTHYNGELDDNLTIDRVTSFDIHNFVKPVCGEEVYRIIEREGFYADLPPIPGAIEAVTSFVEAGHEVVIATAAAGADSAKAKILWVEKHLKHLGFTRRDMLIGHKKDWIQADILIDDSPKNLRKWNAAGKIAMTIEYPWNQESVRHTHTFAADYTNPVLAWKRIRAGVDEVVRNRK